MEQLTFSVNVTQLDQGWFGIVSLVGPHGGGPGVWSSPDNQRWRRGLTSEADALNQARDDFALALREALTPRF